jgi:hypothetical protein
MIYLRDNPLLEELLKAEHTKFRLLGHWGSEPGMSLIYVHLNRLIKKYRDGCDRSRPSPESRSESCWRPCQGAFPKRADCLLQLRLRSRHRQAGDPRLEVAVLTINIGGRELGSRVRSGNQTSSDFIY